MATLLNNSIETNESTEVFLNFVNETRNGKYTEMMPDLTQITYTRMHIQEQENFYSFEDTGSEVILYGISI